MTEPDPENWYVDYTKSHYQKPDVAEEYAKRQGLCASPVDWFVGQLEKAQIRRGVATLGVARRGESVLDVPAGSGKLTSLLTRRFDRYVAGDISPAMLDLIPQPVEKRIVDAAGMPFPDDEFTVVVNLRLLHRVPVDVIGQCVSEALRVSRRGAIVSYASFSRAESAYQFVKRRVDRPEEARSKLTQAQFAQVVRDAGGAVIRDRSISGGATSERVATLARR